MSRLAPASVALDIQMPLLAFMALMLEHGMAMSEQNWARIDAIEAGEQLDDEISRAAEWLEAQGKGNAISPMVRHLCQDQELLEGETHWARVVGVPIVGDISQMDAFAERWAAQDVGHLQQSVRLPLDARWVWLPFAFDPTQVDRWLTAQRRWLLETALDHADEPERLTNAMLLLGQGLLNDDTHAKAHPHERTRGVRLLIGVILSQDLDWLDTENNDQGLLHLGVDLHGLMDEVMKELRASGVPIDDEAAQDHFAGKFGHSLEDLAAETSEAIDKEMDILQGVADSLDVDRISIQPIFPLAESLARSGSLALSLALDTDMAERPAHVEAPFVEAHLARGDTDSDWVVGVNSRGEAWGPYPLVGLTLWDDHVPDMAQEVFEDRGERDHDVELVFHNRIADLPRAAVWLH